MFGKNETKVTCILNCRQTFNIWIPVEKSEDCNHKTIQVILPNIPVQNVFESIANVLAY